MKLPRGYSGGVIPCFYLMAPGNPDYRSVHDEIDFEFIGGKSARDMIMHTNLLSGGQEYLEQVGFIESLGDKCYNKDSRCSFIYSWLYI